MQIEWRAGTVVGILKQRPGLQEVAVQCGLPDEPLCGQPIDRPDIEPDIAIHYTDVWPPLRIGDRVMLNVTAEALKLGSGGYHFVASVLDRSDVPEDISSFQRKRQGHIMKLRYTPLQRAVLAAEEPASPHHGVFRETGSLSGMPVLIGELHSMLPIAACWLMADRRGDERSPRISYMMSDGAALPIAFSRHVTHLKSLGWLSGTITYGHAYGGDLEAINRFTALLAAKRVQHADIAIAALGPGIVGTGTALGHTAVEAADLVHAAHALGGSPIVMPRISFADRRERHFGLSHHLLETLGRLTFMPATVAIPVPPEHRFRDVLEEQIKQYGLAQRHHITWIDAIDPGEIGRRLQAYPEPITTMGRGLREDPMFFAAVCAAACVAESAFRSGSDRGEC